MNLPNKLTVLRMAMVPFFVAALLLPLGEYGALLALLLFSAASYTDLLDGKIARSRGLVTTFGKLMDPLADKILVMSAMICFVALGYAPAWVVIIILAREFLVTSLRLIAAGEGLVIAADRWGKIKTVCQMVWVILTLAVHWAGQAFELSAAVLALLNLLMAALMLASVFFTLLSGTLYVVKNKNIFLGEL